MFCDVCGRRFHFLHKYCSFCGIKLENVKDNYRITHDEYIKTLKDLDDKQFNVIVEETLIKLKNNKKNTVASMNAYDEGIEIQKELNRRKIKKLTESETPPQRNFMSKKEIKEYIELESFNDISFKVFENIFQILKINNSDFQNKVYNETKLLLDLYKAKLEKE